MPSIDPQLTVVATGLISAVAGYLAARRGVKMKQVEKEPEIMGHLNRTVADIIQHYTKALEQEKARHAEHIAEQDEKIFRALARIEQLADAMRSAGLIVPRMNPEALSMRIILAVMALASAMAGSILTLLPAGIKSLR